MHALYYHLPPYPSHPTLAMTSIHLGMKRLRHKLTIKGVQIHINDLPSRLMSFAVITVSPPLPNANRQQRKVQTVHGVSFRAAAAWYKRPVPNDETPSRQSDWVLAPMMKPVVAMIGKTEGTNAGLALANWFLFILLVSAARTAFGRMEGGAPTN